MKPIVQEFFDPATWTLTYVVYSEESPEAIVIDPVWDYDPASSRLNTQSAQKVIEFIQSKKLKVQYILETHAHADHVSGSQILKKHWPQAKIGIGQHIQKVQDTFKTIFNLDKSFPVDGQQFDFLLTESDTLNFGPLEVKTIFTPGHTPACASYLIGDAVFVGDALFMPDYGTGRCDFPLGSANELYNSIHEKLYKLPDEYRVFVGHDYQPQGRPLAFQSSIGAQKTGNIHLKEKTTQSEFVQFRTERDKTLSAPKLLLPSIQININAGHLPPPEDNEVSYLKIPLHAELK